MKFLSSLSLLFILFLLQWPSKVMGQNEDILIGAYYFGGWAGHRAKSEAWDINAPTHLTVKLKKEFSEREPVWGWRDDTDEIMEKQINLARDNGIDCIFFDWYWYDTQKSINIKKIKETSLHDCINRFLNAPNNSKLKFAMMVANHKWFEIVGKENWIKAIDYFSEAYFHKDNYLKVDGKPVLAIFRPKAIQPYLEDVRKEAVKLGYPGLYIISIGVSGKGFDAYSWYAISESMKKTNVDVEKPYQDLTSYVETSWFKFNKGNPTFPLVMAGWDKRPWEENVLYYDKKSPKLFYKHISNALEFVKNQKGNTKMVMIYAWNELGEGGYLVPTKGDRHGAYLKKIKKAKRHFR